MFIEASVRRSVEDIITECLLWFTLWNVIYFFCDVRTLCLHIPHPLRGISVIGDLLTWAKPLRTIRQVDLANLVTRFQSFNNFYNYSNISMKYLVSQIYDSSLPPVKVHLESQNLRYKTSGATPHLWNRTRSRSSRKLRCYLKPSFSIQFNSHTLVLGYMKMQTTCFHLKCNSITLTPIISVINLNPLLRQQFTIRLLLLSYPTVLYFITHSHLQYMDILRYVTYLKLNIHKHTFYTREVLPTLQLASSCTLLLRRL